jgi:GDP-D-mannose dehydratase
MKLVWISILVENNYCCTINISAQLKLKLYLGDATKAKEQLGWEPEISFDELVEDMCIYGQ